MHICLCAFIANVLYLVQPHFYCGCMPSFRLSLCQCLSPPNSRGWGYGWKVENSSTQYLCQFTALRNFHIPKQCKFQASIRLVSRV